MGPRVAAAVGSAHHGSGLRRDGQHGAGVRWETRWVGGDMSMAELARRWDDLLLADAEVLGRWQPTREVVASGSLLRPPASEEQIADAERRLGCELPSSYREFLLVSDGAYGDLRGVTMWDLDQGAEPAPPESDVVGVGFLPVADLRWLRAERPWQAELCEDTAMDAQDGDGDGRATQDGQEVWPWTAFADGLIIATDKGPGTTCLVPFGGAAEWQVWEIAKEISEAYLSFRSLLEHMVAAREPVETAEVAEHVIAHALRGERWAWERLSRITAPDAAPLLIALIERGELEPRATEGLGRIGADEAVNALERLRPRGAGQALIRAGSGRARDVLAAWGCYHELDLLGDPRAPELAVRHLALLTEQPTSSDAAAATVLGRSGDPSHVPLLRTLTEAADPFVVVSAAYALIQLGAQEGRHLLVEHAARDDGARWYARSLLERIDGPPPG